MGRPNGIVVSISAISFGLLAVALSFIAYAKRIKLEEVKTTDTGCSYPHSPSFALGIVAAIVLLIEQLIVSVGIGCFCCCGNRLRVSCCNITSAIFFVLSWISFVIAFLGLIVTAIYNNRSYLGNKYPLSNESECKTEQENLFIGTAIWCVITIVLGFVSYVTFKLGARAHRDNEHGNVVLGQPQMLPK